MSPDKCLQENLTKTGTYLGRVSSVSKCRQDVVRAFLANVSNVSKMSQQLGLTLTAPPNVLGTKAFNFNRTGRLFPPLTNGPLAYIVRMRGTFPRHRLEDRTVLTRKDCRLIARVIAGMRYANDGPTSSRHFRVTIAEKFCVALAQDNHAFRRDFFMDACKLDKTVRAGLLHPFGGK